MPGNTSFSRIAKLGAGSKRGGVSMAIDTISLTFKGYFKWTALESIPEESGVYVVYDGVPNPATNDVWLRRVLYIGEAENVRERIVNHERWTDWRRGVRR